MFDAKMLEQVKDSVVKMIGKPIRLETNRGRAKSDVTEGVITDIYPSIFTVELSVGARRRVSYSYADVFTKTVEITMRE